MKDLTLDIAMKITRMEKERDELTSLYAGDYDWGKLVNKSAGFIEGVKAKASTILSKGVEIVPDI